MADTVGLISTSEEEILESSEDKLIRFSYEPGLFNVNVINGNPDSFTAEERSVNMVIANPSPDPEFMRLVWSVENDEGEDVSAEMKFIDGTNKNSQIINFVMPRYNLNLTANYNLSAFNLKVTVIGDGKATPSGIYEMDEKIRLIAFPSNANSRFINWNIDGIIYTEEYQEFIMPDHDVEAIATFESLPDNPAGDILTDEDGNIIVVNNSSSSSNIFNIIGDIALRKANFPKIIFNCRQLEIKTSSFLQEYSDGSLGSPIIFKNIELYSSSIRIGTKDEFKYFYILENLKAINSTFWDLGNTNIYLNKLDLENCQGLSPAKRWFVNLHNLQGINGSAKVGGTPERGLGNSTVSSSNDTKGYYYGANNGNNINWEYLGKDPLIIEDLTKYKRYNNEIAEFKITSFIDNVKVKRNNIFIDYRDGREYKLTQIGNQVWFAENFRGLDDYSVYNDDYNLGAIYGNLYDVDSLINSVPEGFRIPTNDDWNNLKQFISNETMSNGVAPYLKSKDYWQNDSSLRNDPYGFNALPGGEKLYDYSTSKMFYSGLGNNVRYYSQESIDEYASVILSSDSDDLIFSPLFIEGSYNTDACYIRFVKDVNSDLEKYVSPDINDSTPIYYDNDELLEIDSKNDLDYQVYSSDEDDQGQFRVKFNNIPENYYSVFKFNLLKYAISRISGLHANNNQYPTLVNHSVSGDWNVSEFTFTFYNENFIYISDKVIPMLKGSYIIPGYSRKPEELEFSNIEFTEDSLSEEFGNSGGNYLLKDFLSNKISLNNQIVEAKKRLKASVIIKRPFVSTSSNIDIDFNLFLVDSYGNNENFVVHSKFEINNVKENNVIISFTDRWPSETRYIDSKNYDYGLVRCRIYTTLPWDEKRNTYNIIERSIYPVVDIKPFIDTTHKIENLNEYGKTAEEAKEAISIVYGKAFWIKIIGSGFVNVEATVYSFYKNKIEYKTVKGRDGIWVGLNNNGKKINIVNWIPEHLRDSGFVNYVKAFETYLNTLYYNKKAETISVLEKIKQLGELKDPWLLDSKYFDNFAKTLGVEFNFTKILFDSIPNENKYTEEDGIDVANSYIRHLLEKMPYFQKLKTTPNAIASLLLSFGLVGRVVNLWTTKYSPKSSDGWLIPKEWQTYEDITDPSYFITPHFRVMIYGNELHSEEFEKAFYNLIDSLKPINTVFRGFDFVLFSNIYYTYSLNVYAEQLEIIRNSSEVIWLKNDEYSELPSLPAPIPENYQNPVNMPCLPLDNIPKINQDENPIEFVDWKISLKSEPDFFIPCTPTDIKVDYSSEMIDENTMLSLSINDIIYDSEIPINITSSLIIPQDTESLNGFIDSIILELTGIVDENEKTIRYIIMASPDESNCFD